LAPASLTRNAKVKLALKKCILNANAEVGMWPELGGTASLVFGTKKGFQIGYRTPLSKVPGLGDVAIGYTNHDFEVCTQVTKAGSLITGSLFHGVKKAKVLTSFLASWDAAADVTTFVLGGQYNVADDTFFKAKVDQTSSIGLAYSQSFKNGLTLTVSALLDGKALHSGAHKCGIGIEFDLD